MKTMEDSLDYMQLGEKVEKSGLGKFIKMELGSWQKKLGAAAEI